MILVVLSCFLADKQWKSLYDRALLSKTVVLSFKIVSRKLLCHRVVSLKINDNRCTVMLFMESRWKPLYSHAFSSRAWIIQKTASLSELRARRVQRAASSSELRARRAQRTASSSLFKVFAEPEEAQGLKLYTQTPDLLPLGGCYSFPYSQPGVFKEKIKSSSITGR